MPHLTDAREMLDHLKAAIAGGAAWVILTDDLAAHLRMVAVGMLLHTAGVPEREMGYGCADVMSRVTAVRRRVSFLTAPKARIRARELAALMAGCGLAVPRPRRGQDLILVSRPEGARALAAFMEQLGRGEVDVAPPAGVN